MTAYTVAILGATGAVGQQMIACLEEQAFPVSELRLLASARSAGARLTFAGEELSVERARPEAFSGCDFVFGAADDETARDLVPKAVEAGAIAVDNSHAFRMDPTVPLVIPEVNGADAARHQGIVANPNCATIIGLLPVWPLHRIAGVTRMIVSTYQAASGAGARGVAELESQLTALGTGAAMSQPRVFADQLAENLIPQIGAFDDRGNTSEELKFQDEGRKIMHLPELHVSCTCVRVPVMRSHAESITLEFERDIALDEIRAALAAAPGVRLVDDRGAVLARDRYPMPLDTSDQDLVWVGRLRRDRSNPRESRGAVLWCCGDQVRKGAATNAVQIARLLIGEPANSPCGSAE